MGREFKHRLYCRDNEGLFAMSGFTKGLPFLDLEKPSEYRVVRQQPDPLVEFFPRIDFRLQLPAHIVGQGSPVENQLLAVRLSFYSKRRRESAVIVELAMDDEYVIAAVFLLDVGVALAGKICQFLDQVPRRRLALGGDQATILQFGLADPELF
jgi:hypothetical protein